MEATFQPYRTPESLERPYGHRWKLRLRIRHLVTSEGDVDNEECDRRAMEIHKALGKLEPRLTYIDDWDRRDFKTAMENFDDAGMDMDLFNECLNDLYNWADRCRVLIC